MSRVALIWAKLRDSMWFIPAVITVGCSVLAFLLVWLDTMEFSFLDGRNLLFAVGADGARGVLSTIAGSIITVTGVVFSITIVVLQLASSQFTPRVLRSFTEDRANQVVLGVFIGTFTYSLLVLRTVRSEIEDYARFVPALAVAGALVLTILSIGCLIYFINHIARSIQAEYILERVAEDALVVVDHLFPEDLGEPYLNESNESPWDSAQEVAVVRASRAGYLQAVDEKVLIETADQHDTLLHLEKAIGDFVIAGDPLLGVASEIDRKTYVRLAGAFQLGAERTRYQDVERGLIELTDIGVRALSPGINDPTTALVCIDRLTEVFAALARRQFPDLVRIGRSGKPRVVARRNSLDTLVSRTFGQLRNHGENQPIVKQRLVRSLELLVDLVVADRKPSFRRELEQLS